MSDRTHVLLATLGSQPQVVTFTLDLLLKQYPISQVIVLHPHASSARLQQSLARLRTEFSDGCYQAAANPIHFDSQSLTLHGQPIDDIMDNEHADGTLDTIHQLIGSLKRQGHCIHLSVSGGRRLMSLLAISVAAVNFDRHDHIWHIYTPEHIRAEANHGALMHVPPHAGVRLIHGPFLSLGAYFPSYSSFSFYSAQEEQRMQLEARDRACCEEVVRQSSSAQLRILRAFSQGLDPAQVAAQLHISKATVNSHRAVLLHLCRIAWNMDEARHLTYHFIHHKFASFFNS